MRLRDAFADRAPFFQYAPTSSVVQSRHANVARQVAIVTDASRGVGRGIARELADAGAKAYATGRSEQDLQHMEGRGTAIRCDHRVDADVETAFRRILTEAGRVEMSWSTMSGRSEEHTSELQSRSDLVC